MGERKGVNKYYPPDFDYKKHGSLDRYHNSHPLRERAKKLKTEGILIIRFEMPYNIWCNGCNKHIGMGVRYNSEKKKVGNYYSTIIYKFRMKCHLCEQYFEIQTDPANSEYVILSGARRKEERWNAKDNEQIEMTDHAVKKQLISDPMFKLEHGAKDKVKLAAVIPTLSEIQDIQDIKYDDYLVNKALRKSFRDEKKRLEEIQKNDKVLLSKSSLDIKLLPSSNEDSRTAKLLQYQTVKSLESSKEDKRKTISHQPVLKVDFSTKVAKKLSADNPLKGLIEKKMTTDIWSPQAHKTHHVKNNIGIKIKKRRSVDEPETTSAKLTKVDANLNFVSIDNNLNNNSIEDRRECSNKIEKCGLSLVADYSDDDNSSNASSSPINYN